MADRYSPASVVHDTADIKIQSQKKKRLTQLRVVEMQNFIPSGLHEGVDVRL